jgi:DivIVA domain-containing protein
LKMLKPEQIVNAKFTPVSKGTYSAEEVDAFLKTVASEYEKSLAEKAELIKKISILADKIESYRSDEEAIKLALLDAHKMAESVSKTAKNKADETVAEAETKSKAIVDGANRQSAQLIDEARTQARDIVDNAKNAVASLTERAQNETNRTINAARSKAAEIIAAAENRGKGIIGNSRDEYTKYIAAIEEAKKDAAIFKQTLADLCRKELEQVEALPDDCIIVAEDVGDDVPLCDESAAEIAEELTVEAAEVEETVEEKPAEPTIPAEAVFEPEAAKEEEATEESEPEQPAEEEIPQVEAAVYVPEQPKEAEAEEQEIEEDFDDLFSLIDSTDSENIAADIDDVLPEATEDEVAAEAAEDEEEFEGFKVDLDEIADAEEDDDDDDDDISSLFDSLF